MDAPRYTRAELCLIHVANALAAGGETGEVADMLRVRARAVLARVKDPSPDLAWLVRSLRDALDAPSAETVWRLQCAVRTLSVGRIEALFDPAWEAAHAPR